MTTDVVEEIDWVLGSGATPPLDQSTCRPTEDVATAIYGDAERIKRAELEEALGKLDTHGELSDAQRDVIRELADAIVARLLAAPIRCVRSGDNEPPLDTVVRLFDLEAVADDDETHEYDSYQPEATSVDN